MEESILSEDGLGNRYWLNQDYLVVYFFQSDKFDILDLAVEGEY